MAFKQRVTKVAICLWADAWTDVAIFWQISWASVIALISSFIFASAFLSCFTCFAAT